MSSKREPFFAGAGGAGARARLHPRSAPLYARFDAIALRRTAKRPPAHPTAPPH